VTSTGHDLGSDAAVTVSDGPPTPNDAAMPFSRGTALGRYLVLDPLGEGGMGVVLAAYDTTLDRRVALKLLRPRLSASIDNRSRLLREARALAKLSHPNVVSVFDVGELRQQVFIAMEYVDGPNLRRWLGERKRTPRATLAVFRGAALGLQAAHDAGIVHRDFKPDNVLLGSDGEPRVTDFGLALDAGVATPTSSASMSTASAGRLTETGLVMGTPAYMPIEQHRGLATDHRSDQFSFCVSLFEALYGVRPFTGATGSEYCTAIEAGPALVTNDAVPRRVHKALLRGLSAAPSDRFPSMRALLRALNPRVRNRRTWVLGTMGGLAIGASVVAFADRDPPPCSSFEDRIATAYDADDRRRMLSAFTATGVPYAQASFDATHRQLDAFATQWADAATEACWATERGEQSAQMLDLRMQCLERGFRHLDATKAALLETNARGVERAPALADRLPSLEPCSRPDILRGSGFVLENDEQRTDADELLPIIASASVLAWQGRASEAEAALAPVRDRIERSTHPRVLGEHALLAGKLAPAESELDHFRRALHLGLEHHLHDVAGHASMRLAYASKSRGAYARANVEFRTALALARSSGARGLIVDALVGLAKLAETQAQYRQGLIHARDALAAAEEGSSPGTHASVLLAIASLKLLAEGNDAGYDELERAHALLVRQVGEQHPAQEEYLHELINRANARADASAALQYSERLLTLLRRNRGPRSTREGVVIANMATAYLALGRREDALAATDDCDAIFREHFGDSHPKRGALLVNRGEILMHLGRFDEARTATTAAKAIFDERLGEGNEISGVTLLNLSEVERKDGNTEASIRRARASLSILEKTAGPEHVRVGRASMALAHALLLDDDPAEALRLTERALQIGTPKPAEAQLWSLLHAEATLRAETSTVADRGAARRDIEAIGKDPMQGTPFSEDIARTLGRLDEATVTD